MPKYFFDLCDTSRLERDDVGEELPDDEHAQDRAVELAMELAVDLLPENSSLTCIVRNLQTALVTVKLTLTIS